MVSRAPSYVVKDRGWKEDREVGSNAAPYLKASPVYALGVLEPMGSELR